MSLIEELTAAATRLREVGNEADAALMERAAENIEVSDDNRLQAWAAMTLVHEAIGLVSPPGTLPSEEAINSAYAPTFSGYAQAFVEALAKLR